MAIRKFIKLLKNKITSLNYNHLLFYKALTSEAEAIGRVRVLPTIK